MEERTEASFPPERPLFLHNLSLPSSLRILVLAPHPDDFDAIGVTLRWLHSNGNPIDVAVLTGAASGVEDSFLLTTANRTWSNGGPPPHGQSLPPDEQKAAIREQEQRDSCAFFGLPPEALSFPHLEEDANGDLAETEANEAAVRALLSQHQPDLVFMPHGNDTNPSHRRTHRICREQAVDLQLPATLILNRDPKTIDMRNDLFTVFGRSDDAWKAQLLRCHRSQHQRNLNTRGHGFDDRILDINRDIARTYLGAGQADYAEAFELEFLGK